MKKILQFRSVRSKMLFGFSLILLFVVFLGVYNFISVNQTNRDTAWIVDEQLPILIAGENLMIDTAHSLALARGYLLYGTSDYKEEFNDYMEDIKRYQEEILKINDSDEVKKLFDQMDEWRDLIINDVFTPYDEGKEKLAHQNITEMVGPMSTGILDTLDKLTTQRENLINTRGEGIISSGKVTQSIGVVVSILVIILGLLAAFLTSNSIANPIKTVMERMKLITDGDLSHEPLKTE